MRANGRTRSSRHHDNRCVVLLPAAVILYWMTFTIQCGTVGHDWGFKFWHFKVSQCCHAMSQAEPPIRMHLHWGRAVPFSSCRHMNAWPHCPCTGMVTTGPQRRTTYAMRHYRNEQFLTSDLHALNLKHAISIDIIWYVCKL
jgi:hypothetical protein